MDRNTPYPQKLERMEGSTLLSLLAPPTRQAVRRIAETYRLTYQELRQLAQAARDLEMWSETPLEVWWTGAEEALDGGQGRQRKKELLRRLKAHLDGLARAEKIYPDRSRSERHRPALRVVESDTPRQVFGLCAAYSDRTVCCGLHTIDAVMGCSFGCSYCTIQTFYPEQAEIAADLAGRLRGIELDPELFFHIGTGQSSDSLVWGNRNGILDSLCDFAGRHPNVLLELKTKSDNVSYLLEREVPENLVCSWSLNPETVICNEEHGTASLDRRLLAARAVADCGRRVAFHFHPMVHYHGWRAEYGELAARLVAEFSVGEVAFLSLGSMTFIRPVVREIRKRGGETKVLQMPMVGDPHGKLTYPDAIKLELYRAVHQNLAAWHDEVFIYLCMEAAPVWRAVLGHAYPDNATFELDFARRVAGWSGTKPAVPRGERPPVPAEVSA